MASEVAPEEIKHASPLIYAPFGDHFDLAEIIDERAGEWRPRVLLNMTVLSFFTREDDELNPDQRAAKTAFISTFLEVEKEHAGHDFNNPSGPAPQWQLPKLKELLDTFFFFGCFAHMPHGVRVGRASSSTPVPAEKFAERRLAVPTRNAERWFSQLEVLALLLHEMVHAYLEHHSCKCAACAAANANTIGMAGDRHGPFFRILHRLVLSEVRRWHPSLGGLDAEDCPGDAISTYSTDRAEAAWAALAGPQRRAYRRRRPVVPDRVLIGISEETNTVYVLPEFMAAQLRDEAVRKVREATVATNNRRRAAATSGAYSLPAAKRAKAAPGRAGASASGAGKGGAAGKGVEASESDGIYSEVDA